MDEQLAVMNEAYAPYDIQFTLLGTDWTVNANWAKDGAETTMKAALRKGTYADVNVYFVSSMEALGYCYFPTTATAANINLDGCTILSTTVPGGSLTNVSDIQTLSLSSCHSSWIKLGGLGAGSSQ
jgi:hypothetical protein